MVMRSPLATPAIVGDSRLVANRLRIDHEQALRIVVRVDHQSGGAAMIKGIKFASVPVRDQDKALEFYPKKLGFKVITDSPFDGTQRWIELGVLRSETKL